MTGLQALCSASLHAGFWVYKHVSISAQTVTFSHLANHDKQSVSSDFALSKVFFHGQFSLKIGKPNRQTLPLITTTIFLNNEAFCQQHLQPVGTHHFPERASWQQRRPDIRQGRLPKLTVGSRGKRLSFKDQQPFESQLEFRNTKMP